MRGEHAQQHIAETHVSHRQVRPRVAEITVQGELDIVSGRQVHEALDKCFDDLSNELLSLHLGGVTFIDSSGLRLLIRARRAAKMTNRSLVLTAPSQAVLRLLETTGMDKLFNIIDDPS